MTPGTTTRSHINSKRDILAVGRMDLEAGWR